MKVIVLDPLQVKAAEKQLGRKLTELERETAVEQGWLRIQDKQGNVLPVIFDRHRFPSDLMSHLREQDPNQDSPWAA